MYWLQAVFFRNKRRTDWSNARVPNRSHTGSTIQQLWLQ